MSNAKDIQFLNSIHRVIKYKRGETYYLLKKLSRTASHYKEYDFSEKFYPELHFIHGFNSGTYNHVFKDGELFSDRFELVDWNKIPLKDRKKIVEYHKLNDQVLSNFEALSKEILFKEEIDGRVQEIGEAGGSHKPLEQQPNKQSNKLDEVLSFFDDSGMVTCDTGLSFTITDASGTTCINPCGETGTGITYDNGIPKTYEDEIEPVVYKKKKKKKKIFAVQVDEAKILK